MNPCALLRNLCEVGAVVLDGLLALVTPKPVETPATVAAGLARPRPE